MAISRDKKNVSIGWVSGKKINKNKKTERIRIKKLTKERSKT